MKRTNPRICCQKCGANRAMKKLAQGVYTCLLCGTAHAENWVDEKPYKRFIEKVEVR